MVKTRSLVQEPAWQQGRSYLTYSLQQVQNQSVLLQSCDPANFPYVCMRMQKGAEEKRSGDTCQAFELYRMLWHSSTCTSCKYATGWRISFAELRMCSKDGPWHWQTGHAAVPPKCLGCSQLFADTSNRHKLGSHATKQVFKDLLVRKCAPWRSVGDTTWGGWLRLVCAVF